MPAQIGFFDSLKNTAGKVFNYLASITITGTDGKTITCTQDTSLDEAVAMSSKVNRGAESLKIWTYTHVVTAAEVAAHDIQYAITAVTLSKVRALQCIVSDGGSPATIYNDTGKITGIYLTSATNVEVTIGVSVLATYIISITIVEAL